MSLEKNKALIRKLVEAINRKDLTIWDEFLAPDYFDHTFQLRGRKNVEKFSNEFWNKTFKDLPDFHRTIEDIIAEGDKVWARYKITGTDSTGKKIESSSVNIYRIVNGKIVEGWSVPQVVDKERFKVT